MDEQRGHLVREGGRVNTTTNTKHTQRASPSQRMCSLRCSSSPQLPPPPPTTTTHCLYLDSSTTQFRLGLSLWWYYCWSAGLLGSTFAKGRMGLPWATNQNHRCGNRLWDCQSIARKKERERSRERQGEWSSDVLWETNCGKGKMTAIRKTKEQWTVSKFPNSRHRSQYTWTGETHSCWTDYQVRLVAFH